MNMFQLYRKLMHFVKPYQWLALLTMVLTLTGSVMAQVNAIVLDQTVDALNALVSSDSFAWSKIAKNAYIYDQIMELPKQLNSKGSQLSDDQQHRSTIDSEQIKSSIDASARSLNIAKIAHSIEDGPNGITHQTPEV